MQGALPTGGFVHFAPAGEGKVGNKAPCIQPPAPSTLSSHLSGAGQGCEGSPADPWRDQDPVLSRVMKCEPFPSVIFNVDLLRLG